MKRFESILDLINYVSTCAVEGCQNPCKPGMVCDKHLQEGFPHTDKCPICGSKPERWGLCHKCSQKLYEARKGEKGRVSAIRPGYRTSETCLAPKCNAKVPKTGALPLCTKHRKVAKAHMQGNTNKAYDAALKIISVSPRIVCSIPGCGKQHARCGYCQEHYLQLRLEEHEWLKGKDPRNAWSVITGLASKESNTQKVKKEELEATEQEETVPDFL